MKKLALTCLASLSLALPSCGMEPASAPARSTATITGQATIVALSSIISLEATPEGGKSVWYSLALTAAPSTPVVVTLVANSPLVSIPPTVTVPAGQPGTIFVIGTTMVPAPTTVVITATYQGISKTSMLALKPPPTPIVVTFASSAVLPGESTIATLTLASPAPAPGLAVALEARRVLFGDFGDVPSRFVQGVTPTSVMVPTGSTTATFKVKTLPAHRSFTIRVVAKSAANLALIGYSGILNVDRNRPTGGNAAFDPTLQVPACGAVDAFCDSGALVDGTGQLTDGPELLQPNTINGSCRELASPSDNFHRSSSLDRLKVSTLDGTALAAGKQVKIEATVWSQAGLGWLHLFSAPDATSPAWTLVASIPASVPNESVVSTTFTLPVGALQAVRGIMTRNATPEACNPRAPDADLDDRDDLVFATNNGGDDPNVAPTVNAGPDQIQIPNSELSATLAGMVIDDGLPAPPQAPTTTWSLVSGPGTATFADATALATTVTFSAAGTYFLRLTASDSVLNRSDDVMIITPPFNNPPSVNAGLDQTRSVAGLPELAQLSGSVTDDGLPDPPEAVTATWSLVSGPGTPTIFSPSSLSTPVSLPAFGTYVFRLTANDGGVAVSDEVTVVLNKTNAAPTIDAGPDQVVTLPSSTNLAAMATDDALPNPPAALTSAWSVLDAPSGGTVSFSAPSALVTSAAFSVPGTYTLRVTASDGELVSSDDVTIFVNPVPNQPPTVNAGADQQVTLPGGADLAAMVLDDGLPMPPGLVSLQWSQVDGPGTVTFSDAAAASTTATFSAPGVYVLRASVTDGAFTTDDDVTIVVNPVPVVNQAPVVNAGPDQVVTLPAISQLTGTATDDGLPIPPAALAALWSKVSGPGTVLFVTPNALSTRVAITTPGTYVLMLSAADGALTTTDTMTLVINPVPPANRAPTVNAGSNQSVILPATAALSGAVTDDGRPNPPGAVTTTWSKVNGPGTVTFSNAKATATSAAFSAAGTYVLRLRASDGSLAATDDVSITVQSTTIKVQYRVNDTAANDNQIKPHFNIVNTGSTSVALSSLKLRYWYTVDSNHSETTNCDAANIGCARITRSLTTVNPARPKADRYLEVGFTSSAGNLAPGAQTGAIQLRVTKSGQGTYNEANDYSADLSRLSFVDWTRVTLYRNGTRIWGAEP